METIIVITLIYFILLNVITSYRLIKSNGYEKKQKFYQILIIWLIPILGVILVSSLLNDEKVKISKDLPKIPSRVLELLFLIFLVNYNTYSVDEDGNISLDETSSSFGSSDGGGGE